MKIKTKLFLVFLVLVCTIAIVYFVIYNYKKNNSTTKKIIQSINYNNIKSIKFLIHEVIISEIKTAGSIYDVTDAKIKISNNFKNSQYFESHWSGEGSTSLIIENYDGSIIKISFSFDTFRVSDLYDEVSFFNENIRLFITGLKFDKNSRIFDRESMEKFLLPRVENFEPEALIELINIQSSMVQILLPKTLQVVVANSNDDQLQNLLNSLEKINSMSNKSVVDIIAHLTKNKDINIANHAAGVLKSWIGYNEFLKMSKENKYASIGFVCWFSHHYDVIDTITTIRAIGVEEFDLSYYFLVMQLMENKSKITKAEKKEVFLLMADLIEMQKSRVFLNLLTDLWDAMDMAYDFNKKCLVKKGEETLCGNILEEMRIQAPEVASEIRKWVKNNK